ncbi:MAG: cytochrome c oxidase subunit 3 [Planctomycetota bacterium]|jgi:heme/copper-type cytochrome/quinol oxidase subunit 3
MTALPSASIEPASGTGLLEPPAGEFQQAGGNEPPPGGSGGDGGRGGGDGPFPGDRYQPGPPVSTHTFAMVLFLSTIVMLFVGLIGSYIVLRFASAQWPPPGMPALPSGLWAPTLILLVSSVTMHLAVRSARFGDQDGLTLRLFATFALGLAFCAVQAILWRDLFAAGLNVRGSVYGANFYLLTGLHAFHVAAGVIVLFSVWRKARAGRYARDATGVRMAAMFWHFVDFLWVVLFFVLYVL